MLAAFDIALFRSHFNTLANIQIKFNNFKTYEKKCRIKSNFEINQLIIEFNKQYQFISKNQQTIQSKNLYILLNKFDYILYFS